jgi:hypothetical protein
MALDIYIHSSSLDVRLLHPAICHAFLRFICMRESVEGHRAKRNLPHGQGRNVILAWWWVGSSNEITLGKGRSAAVFA